MKDYTMINEAINVAEDLLKTAVKNYNNYICNTEFDVKIQIFDYIYNQLKKAAFPNNINIRIEHSGTGFVCYDVYFKSGDYGDNGQCFQYQLFIRDWKGKVSRIFFNKKDYYESESQPIVETTLLALIQAWEELKQNLIPAIEKSYQQRLDAIKNEANKIKQKEEILKSFTL